MTYPYWVIESLPLVADICQWIRVYYVQISSNTILTSAEILKLSENRINNIIYNRFNLPTVHNIYKIIYRGASIRIQHDMIKNIILYYSTGPTSCFFSVNFYESSIKPKNIRIVNKNMEKSGMLWRTKEPLIWYVDKS